MKITVDNETCIGCGMCISVCPEVFECADDGTKSVCKLDDIPEDLKEKVSEASDVCPVDAISEE